GVGQPTPLVGQRVQTRCLIEAGPEASQVRPSQVVDVDEHDVRRSPSRHVLVRERFRSESGHFTAPAVMPLRKYRCENRKIASTGMLIISTAAISRFHCVEFSW